MELKQVFGMRLRQSREASGFSLRGLEERMGAVVTYAQLSKYENGLDIPSSGVLVALCNALNCSPDALFRPVRVDVGAIEFRKKTRLSKTSEKSVKAVVQGGVDRYFELEEIVGIASQPLAPTDLAVRAPEEAEQAASEVRKAWKLGDNPISNVVELLEESHVKVQQIEADEGFDGCSGWGAAGDARFPVVVLSSRLNVDLTRKRFTASHELGHLLMDVSSLPQKDAEKACHRFAGAFLLPQDAAFSQVGKHRSRVEWKELAVLKQEYGISMAASLHRLHDLNVISDSTYKSMHIERKRKGWHTREPYPYAGAERCFRFSQLLYRGLAEGKISLSKAAELADTTVERLQAELSTEGGTNA